MKLLTILTFLGITTVACEPGGLTSTPTLAMVETPSPFPALTETPSPVLTPTAEVPPSATVSATPGPEEAILIQEPGPGSQVTNPIRVVGFADPTFEQNLVIRVVTAGGIELSQMPTTIHSDIGQRGKFEAEVPISISGTHNIFIQVYSTSPRDGGVTHLSSTGVIFSTDGLENIVAQEPHPERITIFQPQTGGEISGGVAYIEGFALASFEQTLLVEILDTNGNIVGAGPITVQAPDLGQPGPFSLDLSYSVSEPGPGRVVVRDPSAAFDGNFHLNSVEITLEP